MTPSYILPIAWPNLRGISAAVTLPGAPNLYPFAAGATIGQANKHKDDLCYWLGLKGLAYTHQVHGHSCVAVDAPTVTPIKADALSTTTPNLALAVFSADCIPILAAYCPHTQVEQVFAIHAGRKGVMQRIASHTFAQIDCSKLHVWIGPAISHQHYEVDAKCAQACVTAGFAPQHITPSLHKDRFLCNLRGQLLLELQQLGIRHIHQLESCTKSARTPNGDYRWYSHRRSDSGRMASLIWIDQYNIKA